MNFNDWLKFGIKSGYCGEPVCDIHDTVMTEDDADDYFSGGDNCIFITRLSVTNLMAE